MRNKKITLTFIFCIAIFVCVYLFLSLAPISRLDPIYLISSSDSHDQTDVDKFMERAKEWNGDLTPPSSPTSLEDTKIPWIISVYYRYDSLLGHPQQLEYDLVLKDKMTYYSAMTAIVLWGKYDGRFVYDGISISEIENSRIYEGIELYWGATTPSKKAKEDETRIEYAVVHFEQHDCIIIWDPIYREVEIAPDDDWYRPVIEDISVILHEHILLGK